MNLHCNQTALFTLYQHAGEEGRGKGDREGKKVARVYIYISTFRSGFRGFCGSSLDSFEKGLTGPLTNTAREMFRVCW